MEEILFRATNLLFKNFTQYGYYNEKEVFKVLAYSIIRDFLTFDFDGYLSDKEIREIEHAAQCLLGESCILKLTVNQC